MLADYDKRLSAYHQRFGLTGNSTGRLLARLAGPASMSGRHLLREVLAERGLPSR